MDTGTGVVEQGQHEIVASTFESRPVRLGKDRFKIVFGEIADDAPDSFLEWDMEDSLRQRRCRRFLTRDVRTKGADGREARKVKVWIVICSMGAPSWRRTRDRVPSG